MHEGRHFAGSTLLKLAALAVIACLGGCQSVPPERPVSSIAELYQSPPEHALIQGLQQYEDGTFDRAEPSLRRALELGLRDPHDSAVAYKYLAFIACAFSRPVECERNFVSAFRADPDFRLSRAEIGHPIWGPVYRRVAVAFGVPPDSLPPPEVTSSPGLKHDADALQHGSSSDLDLHESNGRP